ncbi:MAG: DUF4278 domain-containing protein [Elainellaceae cyanobacterium]
MQLKYRGIAYKSDETTAVLPYIMIGHYRGCPVELRVPQNCDRPLGIDRGLLQLTYRGVRFQPVL